MHRSGLKIVRAVELEMYASYRLAGLELQAFFLSPESNKLQTRATGTNLMQNHRSSTANPEWVTRKRWVRRKYYVFFGAIFPIFRRASSAAVCVSTDRLLSSSSASSFGTEEVLEAPSSLNCPSCSPGSNERLLGTLR